MGDSFRVVREAGGERDLNGVVRSGGRGAVVHLEG